MFKRKYNSKSDKSSDSDDTLKEMIAENLLENLMGGNNKKMKHKQFDVYRENNHIYFRSDVTIESCDQLLQLVREFEEDIKLIKAEPYINNDTFNEPKLYIHFTTYGGDLYSAFMVYDNLKASKSNIITIAEGYVASAGTVMLLGGNERHVQKNAVMMIHQLRTMIGGKFAEIEEDFRNSKLDMKRLINLYHTELKGKMTKKQIEDVLTHDIWWNADTCIQKGLCDKIC